MQTSLPDLPFPHADIELNPGAPGSSSSPSSYQPLKTSLNEFRPWTFFLNEIQTPIEAAMRRQNITAGTPLVVGNPARPRVVKNELSLYFHADSELHTAIQDVLEVLGVQGNFDTPGTGNKALIGSPDFSWMQTGTNPHPKLVVEYKTEWVADLRDLPGYLANDDRGPTEQRSVDSLQQLYGYMTFNNNKYGVVTNYMRTWFVCRTVVDNRNILEYFGPVELDGPTSSPTMLKAWVGIPLFADKGWFCSSPTNFDVPPGRFFGSTTATQLRRNAAFALVNKYEAKPENGTYKLLPLDWGLCDFQRNTARASDSTYVVETNLLRDHPVGQQPNPSKRVICKIVDVTHDRDAGAQLEQEARVYAALADLQGQVIPVLYGYYHVYGILRLLALEPVGVTVAEEAFIDGAIRQGMKRALAILHGAGYLHGDVARRNFCVRNGAVPPIDLETCRKAETEEEKETEMRKFDSL